MSKYCVNYYPVVILLSILGIHGEVGSLGSWFNF